MIIDRLKELSLLHCSFSSFPIVALLGPRQCGKTTLAKEYAKQFKEKDGEVFFFDLEDPTDLAKLENPKLALEDLEGLIIIDEIQRRSELFPLLRVLADKNKKSKFLILGSASRDLISNSSETLAGRINYIELGGFSVEEIKKEEIKKLWLRGGFPLSFLAKNNLLSSKWREEFITTFLERDIPNLGIQIPAKTLRRFWLMLSHYNGQIFNASEIGRSLQTTDTTVMRYLDILSGAFVIRQLRPWFYNTNKRLIKRPKIYFRDSGLLHTLLTIRDFKDLESNPRMGASWEGFALEQAIKELSLKEEESYFWGVHTGAELDLVFKKRGKMFGIEVKFNEAPKLTQSMKSAAEELSLEHLYVIYPGKDDFKLDKKVTVLSIENIHYLSKINK